jgi:hypothetical protein
MGCVMGSFGFDLTVHDIYEAVLARYPMLVAKALTDDFTLGIPPPEAGDDPQELWVKCGEILQLIADESKAKAGLALNFSKCNALANSKIPDPLPVINDGVTRTALPAGTTLKREGIRLAGAPIGTDDFCRKYIAAQVRDVKKKMDALRGIDPQTGYALLRVGVVPALMYFSQVTPPHITLRLLEEYDDHVFDCALDLITPPGNPPALTCSATRMQRAREKLQLPIRHGGAGLTRAAMVGPIAFFASVASSHTSDPDLGKHKSGLARFCDLTHALVSERNGE